VALFSPKAVHDDIFQRAGGRFTHEPVSVEVDAVWPPLAASRNSSSLHAAQPFVTMPRHAGLIASQHMAKAANQFYLRGFNRSRHGLAHQRHDDACQPAQPWPRTADLNFLIPELPCA
jgi:hypothetical protein